MEAKKGEAEKGCLRFWCLSTGMHCEPVLRIPGVGGCWSRLPRPPTPTSMKLGRKWGQRREDHACDLILRSLKETSMGVFSSCP